MSHVKFPCAVPSCRRCICLEHGGVWGASSQVAWGPSHTCVIRAVGPSMPGVAGIVVIDHVAWHTAIYVNDRAPLLGRRAIGRVDAVRELLSALPEWIGQAKTDEQLVAWSRWLR
jgi:hypothetical protein